MAGAPAPLAGDDFVFVGADGTHHDRLHHALRANRIGEFFERFLIHIATRLVFAALNKFNRQMPQLTVFHFATVSRLYHCRCNCSFNSNLLGGVMAAKQSVQSPSQSAFFIVSFPHSFFTDLRR